jgi:AcrR family transcriptional regulator
MAVDERERDQAILDATAELLLKLGYDKLRMGAVADLVDLNRGLVYLRFKTKDDAVEATVLRELDRYAEAWRAQVEADPRGGSVGSAYRAMMAALKTLPLASAIIARDEEVFGKYARRPGSYFDRAAGTAAAGPMSSREFLEAMRRAGVVRRDVDVRAVAFVMDGLTPAIRRAFLRNEDPPTDDEPSWDQLLGTVADMLDRTVTPPKAPDLPAGREVLLGVLEQARADLATRLGSRGRGNPAHQADDAEGDE